MAYQKNVAASSLQGKNTNDAATLARATDGNLQQGGFDTRHTQPAWLRVDLVKTATVVGVRVYQAYHLIRFRNMGVNVGSSTNWRQNKVCFSDDKNAKMKEIELYCDNPVQGRYVHLFREKSKDHLSVAEFEVYGYFIE